MDYLFVVAESYENNFEKAIYLHCNLAYLQFFSDVNKRTARMIQTASCIKSGICPLFFDKDSVDTYLQSIVFYYETGDYSQYKNYFLEDYKKQMENLINSNFEQNNEAINTLL